MQRTMTDVVCKHTRIPEHPQFLEQLSKLIKKQAYWSKVAYGNPCTTTLIFTLNANIGNSCKIWHLTGPFFSAAEKYINYLTNLKRHFGKISRLFLGTILGPKIVPSEPQTLFYNSVSKILFYKNVGRFGMLL